MDKDRINDIRQLGDRLADYIIQHEPRLFKRLFLARYDYEIRLELQWAANRAQTLIDQPLLPYERFINVFFEDDGETARPDWYLARDLLMVRIIERLHQSRWIEGNPDVVDEIEKAGEETQNE